MPVKNVTVIQDASRVKEALTNVLSKYADAINKSGVTVDDCCNWIICNEIENMYGFIVENHNPKINPYRFYYDVVVTELGNYLLSRLIRFSVAMPWMFSKDNTINVTLTELDIKVIFKIEYQTDNELTSKLRFF